MKKFLITLILIIIGVFIGDRVIGKVMWIVNQNSKDVTAPKFKYLADDINEDIVCMGTSRCNSHYVPQIIEDSLNMSVYNGGVDGSDNIYSQYVILNIILQHHSPKIVVLDVMPSFFYEQTAPFETISFLAPYVGNNEASDSIFKLAGTYNLYQLSHIYRYNAKAVSNIVGCIYAPHAEMLQGYIPGQCPPHYPKEKLHLETGEPDSIKIEYCEKFIQKCGEKNIKLIFSISPMYNTMDENLYSPLYEIADKYNIPVLNYHEDPHFFNDSTYFKDNVHLWDKGAQEFSKLFTHDLKNLIEMGSCAKSL